MQPRLLKCAAVFLVKDLLEQQFERLIVILRNGILCRKPHVLLHIQRIGKAAARKGQDRIVAVVHGLHNARTPEMINRLPRKLPAIFIRKHEFRFSRLLHPILDRAIQVAIGMARDRDRTFPAGNDRLDLRNQDRRTEHRAVKRSTDRRIGRTPKLAQAILLFSLQVWRNGRALGADLQPLDRIGGFDRHRIPRFFPIWEGKVIILRVKLHKGQDQFLLDHVPDNARHFIAVQLRDRILHLDSFHRFTPCSPPHSGS